MQFRKIGGEMYAPCPFHTDGSRPNFRVNSQKNSWFCDVCGEGGGVVEFLAKRQGRSKKEVFRELANKDSVTAPRGDIAATYQYQNRFGDVVYEVVRLQPKAFWQRRPDGKGGWIWNMDGIERVLYRLPDLLSEKNRTVWIVEGEKDVETLRGIHQVATTNPGGAGKWCDGYSACLKGKDVILCGDNDEAGRKHVQKVIESVETYALSIRRVELPPQFKDISDFASSFNSRKQFAEAVGALADAAPVMLRGARLPIKSMAELEAEYIDHVDNSKTRLVSLAAWLPSLRCVRPLVSGELVSIVGDTGTSKTYVLQHIALHCRVPTLLFELELPDSLTFERFVGLARATSGDKVFQAYSARQRMDYSEVGHVFTCSRSHLSPEEIESLILKSELKMSVRPTLVLVDYVQLVKGPGRSRYERISDVAEQLKLVAKSTGTIIVMASQVGRDKQSPEITIHDAKDSGSIENSSGVVIGIWREPNNASVLNLRVLKNTKGTPSKVIRCQIQQGSLCIVEMSKIDDADIPRGNENARPDSRL